MSYLSFSDPSRTRVRHASIGLVCAVAAVAVAAEPAAGQAVQVNYPGVYVSEVTIRTGVPVSGGEARIVEPRDFGQSDRAPRRIVLEVDPGPLQQALERAHEDGMAFALRGRMPAPADAGEQTYMRIELENVVVTSYSMAGRARVVLAAASDGAVEGARTYEPIVFRKRIDRSRPSNPSVVLEVDGVVVARFAEVSVPSTAAGAKWANITLKRGVTEGPGMGRWREAGRTRSTNARRNGSIVQYDAQGRTIARWHFTNAWPAKWEGPAPKAGAGEALASVTLEAESIRRGAP